jgi:hypothetical protein
MNFSRIIEHFSLQFLHLIADYLASITTKDKQGTIAQISQNNQHDSIALMIIIY